MSAPERQPSKSGPVATALAMLVILGGVGGIGLALYSAFPRELPEPKDPGVLELIFGSAIVIFAARLLLFALGILLVIGAVYVGVSVIVRMKRREWLRRAGWFEVETSGGRPAEVKQAAAATAPDGHRNGADLRPLGSDSPR